MVENLHGIKSLWHYPLAENMQIYETVSHNLLHYEKASIFNKIQAGGYTNDGQRRQRNKVSKQKLKCLNVFFDNVKQVPDLRTEIVISFTKEEFLGLPVNFVQRKDSLIPQANVLKKIMDCLVERNCFIYSLPHLRIFYNSLTILQKNIN